MEPTGTISEYKPTWKERAANALADLVGKTGASRWKSNKIAQTVLGGEQSNLPGGFGLADLALMAAVPGAPAALRASAVPAGLLQYADASKEGNPFQALTVWHGSPHKFNKFDSSRIGTGEGAQAYGHGLYLAENPSVATSYKELVQRDPTRLMVDGKVVSPDTMYGRAAEDVARIGVKATLQKIDDNIRFNEKYAPDMAAQYRSLRAQVEALDPARVNLKEGNLYKVDLPDEAIARMLDWDAPLSQQSKAVQAHFEQMVAPIREVMAKPAAPGWGDLAAPQNFDPSGQELLGLLRNRDADLTAQTFLSNGLGPDVSAKLRAAGIPGIKYFDQMSRDAGQGTRNYVVFPGEENILTILERNGVKLP